MFEAVLLHWVSILYRIQIETHIFYFCSNLNQKHQSPQRDLVSYENLTISKPDEKSWKFVPKTLNGEAQQQKKFILNIKNFLNAKVN